MKRIHHLAVLAMALAAAILSGCAGATRLPARARGPAGENLETKKIDLSFLEVPGTQRQEVVSRLSSVDTTYSNPQLFWGRWSDSKWGYWWFVAGNNAAAGDAKRVWHVHNLLVSFDDNGIVQKKEVFNKDKALWAELHSRLADAPALDLTQPKPIDVKGPGRLQTMTLEKDSIQFDLQRGKVTHFQVPSQGIVRISHGLPGNGANPAVTYHTLHLAEKSPAGKKILFCASPVHVAATFQYLQQYGSPQLRWD